MFYWSVMCVYMQILSLLHILHTPSFLSDLCLNFGTHHTSTELLQHFPECSSCSWSDSLCNQTLFCSLSDTFIIQIWSATLLLKIFQWLLTAFWVKTKQPIMTHRGHPTIQPLPALSSLVLPTPHLYLISFPLPSGMCLLCPCFMPLQHSSLGLFFLFFFSVW